MRILMIPVPLENKICIIDADNPDPQANLLMVVSFHGMFRFLSEEQVNRIIDGMFQSLYQKKQDPMARKKVVQVGDNQVTVIEDKGLEPGEWVVYCNPQQMEDLNMEFIAPDEPGRFNSTDPGDALPGL